MIFSNVMFCPDCYSDRFRLSRLRLRDIPLLIGFKYPVRCRNCRTRIHTSFPQAFEVMRRRRTSQARPAPEEKHPN